MSRRSTPLRPRSRDGTSQRSRRLAALDPAHAPVDERTSADLLRFVQEYARRLSFFEPHAESGQVRAAGTWADLAEWLDAERRPKVSVADMVAYLADPDRFSGDQARWLGRPHFALLLAYVELLGHAREHLNGFTRRHLDHYYRELLRMSSGAPVADRATVILGLRSGTAELRLPAGTELQAGRDAGGVPRIYRTEREIVVNRASVAALRSVFVDRRFTGISGVRADRSLTARQAFEGTLAIALGSPRPGDPVPVWQAPPATRPVDLAFIRDLRAPLAFAGERLFLEHHELRSLMRLFRRRRDANAEWAEINRLMGVTNPTHPRDFLGNLTARVGALDFAADGLPQVSSVDDLYTYRTEPPVRAYIDTRLAAIGYANFVAMMQIKLRIDAEWAEINRLLERVGRRQRGLLEWSLPAGGDPTDFAGNLALALQGRWPPPWPWGTQGIDPYEALLRRMESHLSMPVEQLGTLAAFAGRITGDTKSEAYDWTEVDRILAEAHREKVRAIRRIKLDQVLVEHGGETLQGFDAVARFVLGAQGESPPLSWEGARLRLAEHLERSKLELLAQFRAGLESGRRMSGFDWPDAARLFELAWRHVEGLPEPVAQKVEVRNLYAFEDATQAKGGGSPGWRTFGQRPAGADERHPQGAAMGWMLRSPVLSLSEGKRTLTLTMGFRGEGFDLAGLLAALGLGPGEPTGEQLAGALRQALVVEASTAKGWIEVGLSAAQLAGGTGGRDYWSLLGKPRGVDRPALQLQSVIDVSRDPVAPPKGAAHPWPMLRVTLRPRWNGDAKEWQTSMRAFEPLVLTAVHLKVEVKGLTSIRLQQDDRLLDPRKPFEPFGGRPAVGSRLYLDHPELVRARLDRLQLEVEWMGLPGSLKDLYFNYPGITGGDVFKAQLALVDQNVELKLDEHSLFQDENGKTKPARSLAVANVPAAIQTAAPGYAYVSRSDLPLAGDVRLAGRHLRWELTPVDFGHGIYPALAATKARELAVGLASGTVTDKTPAETGKTHVSAYRVDPPYTPTIKRLTVDYAASIELDPPQAQAEHQLLHVHPFGVSSVDAAPSGLLPRYELGGELYIGVRDLRPPQHLALLLQMAEGTSDPEVEPAPISWSYLAGDRFEDLAGGVVYDSTRGLINSGIVELALPAAAAGGRLPPDLYWIRVAIPRSPRAVCDAVAIRAQAVPVRFEDRGNAAEHYEQPLPVGSIDRLVQHDARIAAIEQPYSSSGGKPGEKPDLFDTRVSERLRHKQRALSAWDYERLVLQRFRQIYKAKCLSLADGVEVIVIPDIRELHPSNTFAPKAPANLLADIQASLAERAPASARVRVRNAHYVAVQVRLGVRFRKGMDEAYAQRRLSEDLIRFLSPWAFDEGEDLMIGGRISANSIIDFIDRRDYVDYVAGIKLFRSLDGTDFDLVPQAAGEYFVATDRPDQVLVAAQQHFFDVIPEAGYQQESFTGINYARIELDFIVA